MSEQVNGTPTKATPVERDAVRAELSDFLAKQRAERAAKATEEKPEPEEKPEEEKPKADPEPEEKPDGESEEEEAAAEEEKKPDSAARGLAKLAKREAEVRQAEVKIRQYRAQAEAEIQELKSKAEREIKAAGDFNRRVKHDPIGAIEAALGGSLSPEDLDYYGRQFHLRAKGATSPEYRAQAEKERAAREAQHTARSAADELAELRKQLDEERTTRALEEQRREYIATVEAAVSDDTPLLAKALKSNPKQTRAELREVGGYLAREHGIAWPKAADVARGWEQWKRARIAAEFGTDAVDRLLESKSTAPPAKPNPSAVANKRPGKTINSDLGSTTPPRETPQSWEERKADVLKAIREGRIE